jgi:hypothetical protein
LSRGFPAFFNFSIWLLSYQSRSCLNNFFEAFVTIIGHKIDNHQVVNHHQVKSHSFQCLSKTSTKIYLNSKSAINACS